MAEIVGYISSYVVLFGVSIGFLFGGLIFAFFIIYAGLLLFKRTRRAVREDPTRALPFSKRRQQSSKQARRHASFTDRKRHAKI